MIYQNPIQLHFEDKDARDEAYAELDKVKHEGDIRNMFTKIHIHNDKVQLSGAALQKLILDPLPEMILEQMHMVDLTRKSNEDIIDIIQCIGRTFKNWEEAKSNLKKRVPSKEKS